MIDRLRTALTSDALTDEWRACLADWTDAEAAERQSVLTWVEECRDELLRFAETVEDNEEIELSLALRYIEHKSHWMMLNTRIQYELFRRGEASADLMYRASVISMLIIALENLLSPEDISRLTRFLAEPLQPKVP